MLSPEGAKRSGALFIAGEIFLTGGLNGPTRALREKGQSRDGPAASNAYAKETDGYAISNFNQTEAQF
ncbi:MAG: hypothetical protein PHW76_04545 [Alphaproteobacteria bacterium]|nr:hypothetical protein [Alphaproteobacteria bacterium]